MASNFTRKYPLYFTQKEIEGLINNVSDIEYSDMKNRIVFTVNAKFNLIFFEDKEDNSNG